MLPSPPLLCGKTYVQRQQHEQSSTRPSYALGSWVWQNCYPSWGWKCCGRLLARRVWVMLLLFALVSCAISIHRWRGGCSANGVCRVMVEMWVSVTQTVLLCLAVCYHLKSPMVNWMPTNFGFVVSQKRPQSMFRWKWCKQAPWMPAWKSVE